MRKLSFVVYGLIAIILTTSLAKCGDDELVKADPRGKAFAGSKTCRKCHQAIYDSFALSAHAMATTAREGNLLKNGQIPLGGFKYEDSSYVQTTRNDTGFIQTQKKNGNPVEWASLDICFGFRHAQTWLTFRNKGAYELPLSYYMDAKAWGTSPGYASNTANFNRFIGTDCFECHSSHIKTSLAASTAGIHEELDGSSLVLGIDCERCHGPAAAHVYAEENTLAKEDGKLKKINSLSPARQMDICAMCHGGNDWMKIESRFKFRPGDSLAKFYLPLSSAPKKQLDVHGNQYRLLIESKCYLGSKDLTCITCHSPHQKDHGSLQIYATICKNCHQPSHEKFCPKAAADLAGLGNKCVDCHMPRQNSEAITFYAKTAENKNAYVLRTHRIAVYDKNDTLRSSILRKFSSL